MKACGVNLWSVVLPIVFFGVLLSALSIFVNSSMIDIKVKRTDVNAYYVPCTEIATELGNPKVSNMIMLGAYIGKSKCVDIETVLEALLEKLGERKAKLIPLNREALKRGAGCIE